MVPPPLPATDPRAPASFADSSAPLGYWRLVGIYDGALSDCEADIVVKRDDEVMRCVDGCDPALIFTQWNAAECVEYSDPRLADLKGKGAELTFY